MEQNQISIVIPLYNPHAGWEEELNYSIAELLKYFKSRRFVLVIVNDGSSINLECKINKLVQSYPFIKYKCYQQNKGKGHAIREGIKMVPSDYYVYTDWDFPFGQRIVYETFLMLENGPSQLVIGRRNETYFRSLPLQRKLISRFLQIANFVTTGFRVTDTQAGLKGLSKKASEILLLTKVNGFIFELEFIRECLKQRVPFSFIDITIDKNAKFSNLKRHVVYKELKAYLKLFLGKR